MVPSDDGVARPRYTRQYAPDRPFTDPGDGDRARLLPGPATPPTLGVMRPLPELTPENEHYWTAGADGVLRVQWCASCDLGVHPPLPACPHCAEGLEVRDLSGRGTVVGVTVNHQQWLPDLEPPYAIVVVALDEDPLVRITSLIVESDAPGEEGQEGWAKPAGIAEGEAFSVSEKEVALLRKEQREPVEVDLPVVDLGLGEVRVDGDAQAQCRSDPVPEFAAYIVVGVPVRVCQARPVGTGLNIGHHV